jgi:hypothetical protein
MIIIFCPFYVRPAAKKLQCFSLPRSSISLHKPLIKMSSIFISCVYDNGVCALCSFYIYFNFAGLLKLFEEFHLPPTWDTEMTGTLSNPHLASYTYVLENLVLEEMITLLIFNGIPLAEEDSGKKVFSAFCSVCADFFHFFKGA